MGMRLFFGKAGAELIGSTDTGVPVIADAEGVGEMVEIGVQSAKLTALDRWDEFTGGIIEP